MDTDARLVERWLPGDERPEILTGMLEWLAPGAMEPFTLLLPEYFSRVHGDGGASAPGLLDR